MEQSKITEYFRVRRGGPRGPSKAAETNLLSTNGAKAVTSKPKSLLSQPTTHQIQPKIKSVQKALAKTPLKRPSAPESSVDSDTVGKRRRMTARRKLLPFYESSDNKSSTLSKQEETSGTTIEPRIREFEFIEFASPKKKEKDRPRPLSSLSDSGEPELEQLPLPAAYSLLKEKFHCADTVVSMLQNRNEMCTFSKLKNGVEKMMRRHFEELDLGKMKTVYPDAYTFRQETNVPGEYSAGRHYHLVITLNSEDSHLSAISLVRRRQTFRARLLAIVKKHHRDFLTRLDPPLEIPDHKVLRWHAGFSIDSVPAIEAAPLPAPPFVTSHVSAKDVLSYSEKISASPVKTDPGGTVDLALKGVSTELLEKIRAKEASRALKNITRDSEREKKLQMLSVLPDIVRVIRGFFLAERRPAVLWEKVREKIAESYSSLPPDHVDEHLAYLVEISEGRVSMVTLKNKKYIKLQDINYKAFLNFLKDKANVL